MNNNELYQYKLKKYRDKYLTTSKPKFTRLETGKPC